jgi:hypothetical protein
MAVRAKRLDDVLPQLWFLFVGAMSTLGALSPMTKGEGGGDDCTKSQTCASLSQSMRTKRYVIVTYRCMRPYWGNASLVSGNVTLVSCSVSPASGNVSLVSGGVSPVSRSVTPVSCSVSPVSGNVSLVSGGVSPSWT